MFNIFVNVDIAPYVADRSEFMAALRQVDRHVHAAAKRVPGLQQLGGGTDFSSRDADFECDDRAPAERLKAKLGETMAVRLGDREVALPVSCSIWEEPLARIHVARKPSPKCRVLQWSLPLGPELMVSDEPDNYVALVKISTKAAPGEVSRALRSLADSLDPQRETAEQES